MQRILISYHEPSLSQAPEALHGATTAYLKSDHKKKEIDSLFWPTRQNCWLVRSPVVWWSPYSWYVCLGWSKQVKKLKKRCKFGGGVQTPAGMHTGQYIPPVSVNVCVVCHLFVAIFSFLDIFFIYCLFFLLFSSLFSFPLSLLSRSCWRLPWRGYCISRVSCCS